MDLLNNAQTAEKILNLACQSIFVLFLGWLFTRLFKYKAPTLRSGVIFLTIVALLVLPFLNFTFLSHEITSFKTELPITVWAYAHPEKNPQDAAYLSGKNLQRGGQNPASLTDKTRIKDFFSGTHVIRLLNGFGFAWGIGFLLLLAHFLYGTASLRSFKKKLFAVPDNDHRTASILEEAKKSFSKPLQAHVLLSRKITSPLATGIFRPLIVLPYDLYTRLSDKEIKSILFHELSHIYHKDQITGILQRMVTALNWWNPFAHALSSDYSRAREEISDNHVLLENNAKEYAECLINLAEKTSLFSRLPVSTGMASPHIPLKERIKNILSKERIMETRLKKSTLAVIVLASVLIIGVIAGHRLTFASLNTELLPEHIVLPENEVLSEDREAEPAISPQEKKKAKKVVSPPKLIKKVDPVYPEEARKKGLEGAVVLEATTDTKGNVVKTEVIKGEHDILNQAAIDAVKQWQYEPIILEGGEPIPLTFTVTCRFNLKDKPEKDIVKLPEDTKLKLIKEVKAVYPEEARKANKAGEVVLEIIVDKEGNVTDVKVKEGEHDILNQAAIDAVKQWQYEPYKIDGVPQKVRYTVKVRFNLR